MQRLLRCDCGFEVREDDDATFVAGVQRHALEAHGIRFTADDVRRLAGRAEPPLRITREEGEDEAHA